MGNKLDQGSEMGGFGSCLIDYRTQRPVDALYEESTWTLGANESWKMEALSLNPSNRNGFGNNELPEFINFRPGRNFRDQNVLQWSPCGIPKCQEDG